MKIYIVIFRSPSSEGGEPIGAFEKPVDAIEHVKSLVATGEIDHSYERAEVHKLDLNVGLQPDTLLDAIYESDRDLTVCIVAGHTYQDRIDDPPSDYCLWCGTLRTCEDRSPPQPNTSTTESSLERSDPLMDKI